MNQDHGSTARDCDAVVIGAGFAGLYALYRLRGMGLSVCAVEAGSGVGGTWYWNRYPGARTDSEAEVYHYWFSEDLLAEWSWQERFPAQAETEQYLNFVADRLDLRKDIRFNTRVTAAHWGEADKRWSVRTDTGDTIRCRYVVTCLGPLSDPAEPPFPGREHYRGTVLHTARWPREGIDLKGKRVGVVGTAATGIQVIQTIASEVAALHVFQRTANYTIPMRNPKFSDDDRARMRARYPENRQRVFDSFIGFHFDLDPRDWDQVSKEDRRKTLEALWEQGSLQFWGSNFIKVIMDEAANREVSDFVREKMRARIRKPELAAKLLPTTHGFGTRRTPLDSGYLEVFDLDHVHLVDVKADPIEAFTETGLRTHGASYDLDVIVLATGFDAGTGTIGRIDIRGRDGRSLKDEWQREIATAMGLQKHGFPNLFMTATPLAPSAAFCNMPTCLQQQVEWIADCISHVRRTGTQQVIEATAEFEAQWVRHHDEVANATLIARTPSWWLGSNVPGKPRRLLSYIGAGNYRQACNEVAAKGYEGFLIL
jgi:acetone monooxygenase (methyl acetate-forming)